MKTLKNLLILAGFIGAGHLSVAQSVPAFGSNGAVISDWFGKDDVATDILVQTDGKIIVAGNSVVQSHKQMIVTRYHPNGDIDSTFGVNGITTTATGTVNSYAKAAALQADGKIVVAGYFDNNFYNDAAVVRYNGDGSIDSSFGTNGIVQFILSSQFDELHDITIQADGKIVVVGRSFQNNSYDFLVIRLLTNGNVDPAFGIAGILYTDFLASSDIIRSVLIQPDGKIVVAGSTMPGSSYFAAARYLTNGALDPTFGTGGKLFISSGNRFDNCYGLALQTDGKIVMAGTHHNNTLDELMIVRITSTGALDNAFGNLGMVVLPTVDATDAVQDVVIQPDGKIMLAANGAGNKALLIRLTALGALDNSFGTLGYYAGNFGGQNSAFNSLVLAGNNSLLACGFVNMTSNENFLVAKVLYNVPLALEETAAATIPIAVYPNPATESITVDMKTVIDDDGTITILDEQGRAIVHMAFGFLYPPVKIALPANTSKGVYTLVVKSKKQSGATRFIIQ